MLMVIKDGRWYSSWPLKDVTLKHVRNIYILMGYVCTTKKEVLHITKR